MALTYGLVFGPALGMLAALLLVGSEAIVAGLVVGSMVGVAVGVLLDADHERRIRQGDKRAGVA